ncbi:MAG: DinB family protein [Gemmatimonadales bacterium]
MDRLDHLRRLFAHAAWANRVTLESVAELAVPPARALRWLGHLAGTESLWQGRLDGLASPIAVWPALSLDECRTELARVAEGWRLYLGALTEADLARRIDYTNSRGERWSNAVDDILTHVVMHGTHHRGQIASEVRAAGGTPATTDFIHAVRQGLLD